jgi:hypothetical protein
MPRLPHRDDAVAPIEDLANDWRIRYPGSPQVATRCRRLGGGDGEQVAAWAEILFLTASSSILRRLLCRYNV